MSFEASANLKIDRKRLAIKGIQTYSSPHIAFSATKIILPPASSKTVFTSTDKTLTSGDYTIRWRLMMSGEIVRQTTAKKTHHGQPNHELELKNYRKPYRCDGCKEHGYGPRYRCDLCDYDLHEECMFTTHTTSHDFFKGSTFKFFNHPPGTGCVNNCDDSKRYCDACGQAINGFVYHCEEKGWDLHPCCRNLRNKIYIDGVKFRLCTKVSQKCLWCKKRKLSNGVKGIPGWSYFAKSDNCHFHVYCATEMVLESWKNGPKDNNCLALENLELELPLQANLLRKRGKGSKYLRIVKFLGTILAILLGDPTITLACLFVELVSK